MRNTTRILLTLIFAQLAAEVNAQIVKPLDLSDLELIDPALVVEQLDYADLIRLDLCPIPNQDDYTVECNTRRDEKRSVVSEDVTIKTAADAEQWRCAQEIQGDLIFEPNNDNIEIVLPYLIRVKGDIKFKAGYFLDKGNLPQLCRVDGRIMIDNRQRSLDWQAPDLFYHTNLLDIQTGVSNPLSGLNNLKRVASLRLHQHPNDDGSLPVSFSGLNGLVRIAGDFDIDVGTSGTSGNFLAALKTIDGDVDAYLDGGKLTGLSAVETIGGDLTAEWSGYYYSPTTQGLESLETLGGDFTLLGGAINNLSGLQSLTEVGGTLTLETSTADFSGLDNLASVYELDLSYSSAYSLNGLQGVSEVKHLVLRDTSLADVSALMNASTPLSGSIRIEDNYNLCQSEAEDLVKILRNDPNWNIWDSSGTTVKWNDDC